MEILRKLVVWVTFSGMLNINTISLVACMINVNVNVNFFLLIIHCAQYKSPVYILECIYLRVYLFEEVGQKFKSS